jgi:hypothetical protein
METIQYGVDDNKRDEPERKNTIRARIVTGVDLACLD